MTWVFDGQKVRFVYNSRDGSRKWVLCTVACGAGRLARVVNETYGIDRWVEVEALDPVPVDIHEMESRGEYK